MDIPKYFDRRFDLQQNVFLLEYESGFRNEENDILFGHQLVHNNSLVINTFFVPYLFKLGDYRINLGFLGIVQSHVNFRVRATESV